MFPGVDIAGICLPATEVGGDYFDYFQKNGSDTELGFTVADVSGKGMRAAMTAVMVSGMLHAEAARELKADEILTHINAPLYQKNRPQNVHSPSLRDSGHEANAIHLHECWSDASASFA